ncbi:Xylose isomerase [Blattella germanica]|nr:Xylose isomerase [Blattella germanica]
MSLYGQAINKRQKTAREVNKNFDGNEFFPGLSHVEYRPDAGPEDTLCYRYYNASERIHGRTMEEWLRPSVSFWHAFCYAGVKYWTAYDHDIAPEGDTLEDTNHNLDEVCEVILELQQRTGVKPLWIASNLHSHPRYMKGATTSSEVQVVAFAGAQLKKSLEVTQKLGGECFLFRSTREGYASVLNTDIQRELRNYSRLLKMIHGQLLMESYNRNDNASNYKDLKWGEAPQYQYNWDAMSSLCFLKHYNLDRYFKLSVPPGHQLLITSMYGMLGSLDVTPQMCRPNIRDATLLMKTVIEQGGMQPGGLNIGVPLHRESTDLKDLMVAYVSYIDIYARGLRNAAKIVSDGVFTKNLQVNYKLWQ